jgi:hypothetical protein
LSQHLKPGQNSRRSGSRLLCRSISKYLLLTLCSRFTLFLCAKKTKTNLVETHDSGLVKQKRATLIAWQGIKLSPLSL